MTALRKRPTEELALRGYSPKTEEAYVQAVAAIRHLFQAGTADTLLNVGHLAMTTSDLQRLERELKISLPSDYKTLMTAYPFPKDSFSADCLLPDNADILLELSRDLQKLPPHSFVIGDDSADETYFLDVSLEHSPVYVFDVQTGEARERFASLDTYIQHCRETDEDLRRYADRVEKRKWWQFWIPKQ